METVFTSKHYSQIGVRGVALSLRGDGSINDHDAFRFERDMDAWASTHKAADVGVPDGEGWAPQGNPHVDASRPTTIVQAWVRK